MTSKDILKNKNQKPYINLSIDENYDSFVDFYSNNKEIIFKNIVEVFKGLCKTKKNTLKLVVVSRIDGLTCGTEFTFGISETKVLMDDILPYFEQLEEYEICADIIKINKSIEKKQLKINSL